MVDSDPKHLLIILVVNKVVGNDLDVADTFAFESSGLTEHFKRAIAEELKKEQSRVTEFQEEFKATQRQLPFRIRLIV